MSKLTTQNGLPWHVVEKAIYKEIEWLKSAVSNRDTPNSLGATDRHKIDECDAIYRKIAIMIVTGEVRVREIFSKKPGLLWGGLEAMKIVDTKHKHGHEWHHQMMNVLDTYFTSDGYEITTEPHLNHGRADLGAFKANQKPLYIEVGTTSVYKLLVNLASMKNSVFLLVPSNDRIVELETYT
jgi:hypothetical protein